MNIKEVRQKKVELENKVLEAVSPLVNKFEKETGFIIHSVDSEFVEDARKGDKSIKYILVGFRVYMDI